MGSVKEVDVTSSEEANPANLPRQAPYSARWGARMSNDSCKNCTCYATQDTWFDYHVWYQTTTSCFGIVANLLILATLLAARISHSCHVYVLVLTLADLGFCLCRLNIFHYSKLPQGWMGLWQCRSLFAAYNLCRGLGNWVMVLLAADRLRVVVAPLRTHAKGRRTQCATALTCGTSLALLAVNLPRLSYIVQYQDMTSDDGKWVAPWCTLLKTDLAQALRAVDLAFTFHIPVVTNAVVNVILCGCLYRMRLSRRRLSQMPASHQSSAPGASAERQLTHMLVASSVMHSFFSLPLAWLEVVNLRESFVTTRNYFMYLCINYAFGIFYSWHVFINLPIYLVYNSAFKAQFLRLLLPCWYRTPRIDVSTRDRTRSSVSRHRLSETNK